MKWNNNIGRKMNRGYLQEQIINLGKKKGYVTSEDVKMFYQVKDIEREMNKLVALGYFEKEEDMVTFIKWKYKGGKNDRNK